MPSRSYILLLTERARWRIAIAAGSSGRVVWIELPLAAAASADDVADAVAGALARAGRRGPLLWAIPSSWCLSASVVNEGRSRRRDEKSRLFRFEEKLPLAAEEIVADFADGLERSLGVAARIELLRPVIDALESRGIAVDAVAPAALLTAQGVLPHIPAATPPVILLHGEGDAVNVITLAGGRPAAWSIAAANPGEVSLHVGIARQQTGAGEVSTCAVTLEIAAGFPDAIHIEGNPDDATGHAARRALAGQEDLWIDLRRGALAARERLRHIRTALDAALAGAAVLLLALSVALFLRGARYDRAAEADRTRVTERFRAEFPNWSPPPVNVAAVVESEHRKLSTQQLGARQQAAAESGLRTLVRVLGAVPQGAEAQLEKMTFDDRGFALEGRVATPGHLDAVASAIRSAGLTVAPAQAQRDPGGSGWEFTLRGDVPAAPGDALSEMTAPTPRTDRSTLAEGRQP